MAKEVVHQRGLAIGLACSVFSISESCYRYEPKQDAENALIADWLIRLTDNHRTGDLAFATCTCAMSGTLAGITSVCTASTGSWS